MNNKIIAPSILAADHTKLLDEIKDFEKTWIHVDVMDGHFVDNINFGPKAVKDLVKNSDHFIDVHLMIENPDKYLQDFIDCKPDLISFHYEATTNVNKLIQSLKTNDILSGLVINPDTKIDVVFPFLKDLDLVLIMSVYPGKGGQGFIENSYQKIIDLKKEILAQNVNTLIELDGGINKNTIPKCSKNGADIFVAGSAIFNNDDKIKNYNLLKELC